MNIATVGPNRIVDHIEYVADLVGIEFVGFGSDFDGIPALPEGLESAADMPKIIQRMVERDFSETDIRKVCWENFKRVLALNA
jgi:membrane dipeptidase